MRVNFVFQDDRGCYSDKLAKVELIDTEQRKLVKDALDILKKRQVPSRTWGVESVRVRCSINKSDLHNNDGPTFELFEDDFLHCTICPNGDDYIVVTQQENSHVAIPKKQEPSASNTRQDCSIQNGGKVISKIWHADQIEPIGEPPKEGSVHSENCSDSVCVEVVEKESSPQTRSRANAKRSFAVGSDHFLPSKGLSYPVKVKAVKPRSGKLEVKFVGYSTTRILCKDKLLRFTPTRQHIYEEALQKTLELKTKHTPKRRANSRNQQDWQKQKRNTCFPRPPQKRIKLDPAYHLWPNLFGPCTNVDDLPLVHNDDAASTSKCFEQIEKKRRIYYAEDGETPKMIACRFKMDVNQILYDNRQRPGYEILEISSKLKVNSPIVLPLLSTRGH
eukprot:scaffold3692_cov178-Chaetoceros_neogracile.AAC.3